MNYEIYLRNYETIRKVRKMTRAPDKYYFVYLYDFVLSYESRN